MTFDLSPGFAEPVIGAQQTFRAVLDAMAHPGRRRTAGVAEAPRPLCPAAASVLLTLADHETPLWLDDATAEARHWIEFHTGASVTQERAKAAFAVALAMPDLETLFAGTDEAPETSATLIVQVGGFDSGCTLLLDGPGLRETGVLRVEGIPEDFISCWERNRALFPRGVDLILCAGNELVALPRSVSVRRG